MLERFKVPEEIAVNVDYQDMHTVVTQIFKVLGSPLEDAVRCANTLLYADIRSVDDAKEAVAGMRAETPNSGGLAGVSMTRDMGYVFPNVDL